MTDVGDMRVVQTAYDEVAELYTAMFRDALDTMVWDRAILGAFVEFAADRGPVADLGCGPGRITTYLHAAGLDVRGIDLSPEMIRLASRDFPDIRFEVGSMEALDLPDAALGSIVAWYSIIHTPPERLPAVFDEFARVLRPEGLVQLAFFATDQEVEAFDHKVATGYRWDPERLSRLLARHGLRTVSYTVREPDEGERGRQGYLMAVKDA
ncbi:class I SAM-dependent methyltransferase [Nocardia sp. NPDC050406]|uniref:class I SAM-dependent methyltransferase n=1 Tax=Nocardia sp. NPDC050406 TaxID=3364318 RepID=UPI00379BA167